MPRLRILKTLISSLADLMEHDMDNDKAKDAFSAFTDSEARMPVLFVGHGSPTKALR